jgi:hypothetical protein
MTDINRVRQGLQKLLKTNVDPSLFPVKKGDKINIGSFSVVGTKGKYTVKSYKSKTIVVETYTKTAAIAIAKNLAKKKNIINRVMELDEVVAKHTVDCMFYEHIIKKSSNPVTREATRTRWDISMAVVENAREKLSKFIL